jgi:hypothetical protein
MRTLLDIFNDDAFSVTALTAAILAATEGERVPGIIDDLFHEEGMTTLTAFIELDQYGLALVPDQPRGAPGSVTVGTKRKAVPVSCAHLPTTATIMADAVQGVREFGTTDQMRTVQSVVTKRLLTMRRRLEATQAYHRIGAIKGQILDADGQRVLLDVFTTFGVQQQSHSIGLLNATADLKTQSVGAKRMIEDTLGDAAVIRGYRAICGRGFFDKLTAHPQVKAAYDRWNEGEYHRQDQRPGFSIFGITWREYYGKVGGQLFIPDNAAYLIPEGVDELFITRYGPADYMDTVNTIGLPFYSSSKILAHNKGIELEAQSNPLNLCTRPRAIIKLVMDNSGGASSADNSSGAGVSTTAGASSQGSSSNSGTTLSPTEVSALLEAIADLQDEANSASFTNDGTPTAAALSTKVGKNVSAADRDYVWTLYQTHTDGSNNSNNG